MTPSIPSLATTTLLMAASGFVLGGGRAAAGAFSRQTPAPAERSVLDGVYTEEQARRGEPLYAQSCSSCHGQSLEGMDMAPTLNGGAFLSNWNGLTVGDLFERIRLSMPQDDPGRLSRQQDADIVAYILQVNRYPAGKTELPRETEVLKQIKFDAPKGLH